MGESIDHRLGQFNNLLNISSKKKPAEAGQEGEGSV